MSLPAMQRRQVALLLIAADSILAEDHNHASHALDWAQRVAETADKHSGDCTKEAHTCALCMVESYEQAVRVLDASDDWIYEQIKAPF